MATTPNNIKLDKVVQAKLIEHVSAIMQAHKSNSAELRNKLEVIDIAYARYANTKDPVDGQVQCDAVNKDNIIAPIVVSEVDAMLAYLAEVFLSGAPLFPVVSTPKNRLWAEQLETLIDDHATLGQYARHLMMFLLDSVKYNFSAIEAVWSQIDQFDISADLETSNGRRLNKANKKFTKLKRLDPYNTIWDTTCAPAEVAMEGDYAGYIQVISRMKLKRIIQKLRAEDKLLNENKLFKDNQLIESVTGQPGTNNYYPHPTVSEYITIDNQHLTSVDWFKYFGDDKKVTGPKNYEHTVLYVRIVPSDFMMPVPQPKVPQIWKLEIINDCIIINAERIISAYDTLPIYFGQPLEDGLGLQTKSIAEGSIPFQQAATTLYGIRFAAARRAVSDRALYDPDMINPSDINKAVPAPKIPVRASSMKEKGLDSAYKQIPFDMRGTETTLSDAAQIANFSKDLNGINAPRRGQFQQGNKSVQEWNDTMGGADNRLRLRALCLEYQIFLPLKENIKLNIFQYGEDSVVVSQKNGQEYDIKIDELRQKVLAFRIADGYSPKSKLASTETLTMGFQMISNSPILQQAYGSSLPGVFAHLMSLGGVKGFEEYNPEVAATAPNGNLAENTLQSPLIPAAAAPLPTSQPGTGSDTMPPSNPSLPA